MAASLGPRRGPAGPGRHAAHEHIGDLNTRHKVLYYLDMALFENITQAVGNTPLVRINRLFGDTAANVLPSSSSTTPVSSVKDRIGVAIIDAAEASGELQPGGTIVEGTSGNTGIALALVGAARGYKVVLTMPETMSAERKALLRRTVPSWS